VRASQVLRPPSPINADDDAQSATTASSGLPSIPTAIAADGEERLSRSTNPPPSVTLAGSDFETSFYVMHSDDDDGT